MEENFDPQKMILPNQGAVQGVAQNAQVPQSKARLAGIILVGAILILIAGFYYLYTAQEVPDFEEVIVPLPVVSDVVMPGGTLYLTLSPKNATAARNEMGIYALDMSTKALTPYYVPEQSPAVTGRVLENGDVLTSVYASGTLQQIARINSTSSAYTELTQSNVAFKRNPSWSTSLNALVYGAQETLQGTTSVPNNYAVYLVEGDKTERRVTEGAHPALAPDGRSVVVLKNDGLYKVDLSGTSSGKIWGIEEGAAKISQQFSLSPKGNYIAWTFPDDKKIYVVEVLSWTPFVSNLKFEIEAYASWPIFSPDEAFLSFEEFDWGTGKQPSQPRVTSVHLRSKDLTRTTIADLSAYDIQRMFITDWK
jgi:hypothetical protein